jgi:mannose-6-phosphate isomerase-like protein (cupin superfamily)
MRLMGETMDFRTRRLPREYDELAPDGSEIRVLMRMSGGQLTHCTLPSHETSDAVYNRTVEEIWYCLRGRGEVWRRQGEREEASVFEPGVCVSVPPGTRFQFRNTGEEPLEFVIATIPRWPGYHEAVKTERHWA